MRSRKPRVPSYRLHKPSGRAIVTLNGDDHYLGDYGTEESKAEYRRLTGLWLMHGGQLPDREASPTVNALLLAYLQEAESRYQRDGKPTTEFESRKLAIRYLRPEYGLAAARSAAPTFGSLWVGVERR